MNYLFLRHLHTSMAVLTIAGFMLRGYWMLTGSEKLQQALTRILPHIVDTIFLASGIAMLVIASLNPFSQSWLVAKFAGLLLYILLGTVALRRGPTPQIRLLAFVAALSIYGYVIGVALSKSPASWIRYFA